MSAITAAQNIRILGASAVAVSGAADTAENILATITVPAGAMGLNGSLRITTTWAVTNGADDKILRVRFSGGAGTTFMALTQTTVASVRTLTSIQNRAAANSQVGFVSNNSSGTGTSTAANVTAAVDTAAATTVVISGQKETGGDTLTLESYLVELIIP